MKELTCSQVPYLFCLLVCQTRFAKFFLMKLPAVEFCQSFLLKKLHAMGETCTLFTMRFFSPGAGFAFCTGAWGSARDGNYRCIIWSSGNEFLSPMNEFMDAYGPWLVTALPSFSCIPPLKPHFSCRVDVLALTGEACVTLQLMASTFRADLEFLAVPALPVSWNFFSAAWDVFARWNEFHRWWNV